MWDVDLVMMTRILVNDVGATQKYADEYLRRVLICAGILVKTEIELNTDYQMDIGNVTISPDPIVIGDGTMQALLPLKAATILNQGAFVTSIGRAIRVRDGDSAIDTSVSFAGWRDILKLGPAAAYEQLKWQIRAGAAIGGAVLGPYRGPNDGYLDTIAYFFDDVAASLTLAAGRRPVQ